MADKRFKLRSPRCWVRILSLLKFSDLIMKQIDAFGANRAITAFCP